MLGGIGYLAQNQAAKTPTLTQEQSAALDALTVATHLNLSMAYLKLNNVQKAFEAASKALELEPRNAKAVFRRGQALLANGDADSALADFEASNSIQADPAVANQITLLKRKREEQERKNVEAMRANFSKMFTQ
jgi:tetratricopeptide (TPR) repeat protein